MPDKTTLTVKLVGTPDEDGAVYFSDFEDFCNSLQSCLRRAEVTVYGRAGQLRYKIQDLRSASAEITLEAVMRTPKERDRRKSVFNLVKGTVRSIQSGRRLSPRVTPDDVAAYKKLALPLSKGVHKVWVDDTEITLAFVKNADRILKSAIMQNGSVTGVLEKLNIHNDRNEFVLFPPVSGYAITCTFKDEMLDQVRKAVKRTVTVTGELEYNADAPFPKKASVESMEIHPDDDALPSIIDLRGYAKGCTGEMTSAAYIDMIRNG